MAAVPVELSSPGAVQAREMEVVVNVLVAKFVTAAGAVVSVTVTALLNADERPEEEKHILIDSAAEYCIVVYVMMPAVTAVPFAGEEVNVPEPVVPPHDWVESTAVRVIVFVLSEVTVVPN